MSYEAIAILMFSSMLLLMLTGQRVFAAIGFVSARPRSCCGGMAPLKCPSTRHSSCSTGIRC
jgi:hypothetical protein